LQPALAQERFAPGGDPVGVFGRDNHAADTGVGDQWCTGPGAAVMDAWLQRAVERRSRGASPGVPQRVDLGVRLPRTFVCAAPYDHAVTVDYDRADHRVGRRPAAAPFGQVQRLAHVKGVAVV
jgi:hypothetical protein